MSESAAMLAEFDQEMAGTRRVLERVPEDRLDWRAHPRSNTIGWNANHLVDLPDWAVVTMTSSSWDFAPVGGEMHKSPRLTTRGELLELFDRNVAAAREALASAKDGAMAEPWSLLQSGNVLFTLPKGAVIRSFVLNHMIHHRAILCVYLRLLDIPVPGLYGPSGDE